MRILGLDPSLTSTGWGVIDVVGNKLSYVADGIVTTLAKDDMSERLVKLHKGICEVVELYKPDEAAIEEVFLNSNPHSSLKLGQARGVIMLAPAIYGISVAEYEPNKIKKAVVGVGHAEKHQVESMMKILLPGCKPKNNDSADALAVAICHNAFRIRLK